MSFDKFIIYSLKFYFNKYSWYLYYCMLRNFFNYSYKTFSLYNVYKTFFSLLSMRLIWVVSSYTLQFSQSLSDTKQY